MFFRELPEKLRGVSEVPVTMQVSMGILALTCILTGILFLQIMGTLVAPAVMALARGIN
jgi:formate hydrogenlyase subunit 3/multisubunit Na+/H+ antiporter MnhD subunit